MLQNILLHQKCQQQAVDYPNAVALTFNGESMTYAELNIRSNRLAHYLQTLGVKPEVVVGLCLDRGFDLVVAIFAILKAGGAYLPLDNNAPSERLVFILQDSATDIVLTQTKWENKFSSVAHLINLDVEQVLISSDYSEQNLEIDYKDDPVQSLCYVMYTSGSTGLPKGVQITQHNVLRLFSSTEAWFNFSRNDVWALFHSYAFDMSVWEIWGALLYGGRLVIVPHITARTPEQFYKLLVDQQVTFLNQTPSAFAPLVRIDQHYPVEALSLRCITFGGEALNFKMLEPWLLRHGDFSPRMINMYGITETTVHSSYRPVTLQDIKVGNSKLIGVSIPDLDLHLLDEALQPVAVETIGEIVVGGDGVARGYLNRPELNQERFIALAQFPGQRLYRSGDLAKRLINGDMEYIGRADTQVKIRGFRIELGEIEAVLTGHDEISETVVTVFEQDENKRLAAYLVLDDNACLAKVDLISELRVLAAAHLPDYMQPTYYTLLAKMPLNVNGKVDRKALPEPDSNEILVNSDFSAPKTSAELALATIWKEVLKLEKMGVNDNFFQLGGDSILAIQLISKANRAGMKLAPNQLFLHQTIAELALQVNSALVTSPVITNELRPEDAIILSPAQQWFFEQKINGTQHWNQSVLLKCKKILSATLIESALQALQKHHDSLRYRFINQADSSVLQQCMQQDYKLLSLSKIDLSDYSSDERLELLAETVAQAQSDLNLQKGILMRALLFKLDDHEQRLLIIIHHLVVDGVSWRILLEDLETAIQQIEQGLTVQLPRSSSFSQWTQTLQSYSHRIDSQKTWLALGQNANATLPIDLNGVNNSGSAKTHTLILNQDQTKALLHNKSERIQDVLLTALVLGLRDWLGGNPVLIDLEGHGREAVSDLDLSRTCGWLTAIYPFFVDMDGEPSEVLRKVKNSLAKMPLGLDFGVLRYLSDQASALKALPKSQLVFNYLGQFDQLFNEDGLFELALEDHGPTHDPRGLRPYLLEINALIYQGQLKIDFIYSVNQYRSETIENIALLMQEAICSLTVTLSTGDFSLAGLSVTELTRLQSQYSSLEALYPLSPTQEGMLFHALSDSSADVYFEQFSYDFKGSMNPDLFQQAWRTVVQRHSVLRTAVVWKGLLRPLQAVVKQIDWQWQKLDLHELTDIEVEQSWQGHLSADRKQLFELDKAPLMRWTLIQMPNGLWRLLWTHSHIVLDGWSVALITKDVLQIYNALLDGKILQLPSTAQYRDYIAWLECQDEQDAQIFWREAFLDAAPGILTVEHTGNEGYCELMAHIPESDCLGLQSLAQNLGVTLNTLVQAAWALVMAEHTGVDEVLFGITVSGRSNDLNRIETMAGLFINTLPLSLQLDRDSLLADWLKVIQTKQFTLQQYEYSSLADIRDCSGISVAFDSILIFENYPVDKTLLKEDQALRLCAVKAFEHTNYPLTLLAIPDKSLNLQITYNSALFSVETINNFLHGLSVKLRAMSLQSSQNTLADFFQSANSDKQTDFLQSTMTLDEDF
jgi:amino acid adenylation domain-containing protein/non-ribosomal peptide synthase protein (TIGR01720 family)